MRVYVLVTMVLDLFSAVSLTANIIQFLDFTAKIISASAKAYKSPNGTSAEYVELDTTTKHLKELASSIQAPLTTDPNSHFAKKDEFEKVRQSCLNVASELIDAIDKLKVRPGSHQKWNSFRQALINVWKQEKKVDELQKRLSELRQQVGLQMM